MWTKSSHYSWSYGTVNGSIYLSKFLTTWPQATSSIIMDLVSRFTFLVNPSQSALAAARKAHIRKYRIQTCSIDTSKKETFMDPMSDVNLNQEPFNSCIPSHSDLSLWQTNSLLARNYWISDSPHDHKLRYRKWWTIQAWRRSYNLLLSSPQ